MTPRCSAWCYWGLLTVWLCLGNVAFAEQINLWDETSTQDEAALAELGTTLKSDASSLEDQRAHSVMAIVPASTVFYATPGICRTSSQTPHCATALRSHQQVSVYRI